MQAITADDQTHFAMERLLEGPASWRGLVRDMVRRWPDRPAAEPGFALCYAASAIEGLFETGSPAHEGSAQGYKLAALLAADLYAMERLGLPRDRARDFLTYWKIDPYFLNH